MPHSRTVHPRLWIGPLLAVVPMVLGAMAVHAATNVADPDRDMPVAGGAIADPWATVSVSSDRSVFHVDDRVLRVALASGDRAAFSRTGGFDVSPALRLTFNYTVQGIHTAAPAAQVLRVGSGFAATDAEEPAARTYAALGIATTGSGIGFQLRELVGGQTSATFEGTQAITWILNRSGQVQSYSAPNGTTVSVGADRMDVWVGRNAVFHNALVTTPSAGIESLKWTWSAGAGQTNFDHFDLKPLQQSADVTPAAALGAAVTSDDRAADAGVVELYRPSPNPFVRTTRFAYAIPSGSARVDIGVYDVGGRRIRSLVHAVQTTGQYETLWDGLGDNGARVHDGVYFMRAAVGTERRVARVVYLIK